MHRIAAREQELRDHRYEISVNTEIVPFEDITDDARRYRVAVSCPGGGAKRISAAVMRRFPVHRRSAVTAPDHTRSGRRARFQRSFPGVDRPVVAEKRYLSRFRTAAQDREFPGTTRPRLAKLTKRLASDDVVITLAVDRLSRDTTDLLVTPRVMQRAGAGIGWPAEPYLDTMADFSEIVFAIFRVAVKLKRRRIH
jgi:hypothetical protein